MKQLTDEKYNLLLKGTAIPAHPLALHADKTLDVKHQRALTRYYIDSGAGGIAIGVHSTQFEIRNPQYNLFKPVLKIASEEVDAAGLERPFLKIAGVCGPVSQAKKEAETALELGYDMVLLSMGGLAALSENDLIERTQIIADVLPVFGFYLQPSVGGRVFSYDFWCRFAEIENVLAIKTAPFNRYYTFDVVRAVCNSSRNEKIAIYTGNDDNIINDLLSTYRFEVNGKVVEKDIVGGLLGHWAVWTKKAVEIFNNLKTYKEKTNLYNSSWLTLNLQITDANAAFFDPAHSFKGCISGIHEVLMRQGLMESIVCLSNHEELSPGQTDEIDRVYKAYPFLNDDDFIKANLEKWLK